MNLRGANMQDAQISQASDKAGLTKGLLRSGFAKALHFANKPQAEDIHAKELDAMESALKSLVSGDTMEDLQEQLEGQRNLVRRLKGNLQDNQSKMRSVLGELKAARKRLSHLDRHIKAQQKDLFEKSMIIDSQRVEIEYLREKLDDVTETRANFSNAQALLTNLQTENQTLKSELSDIRRRNSELETLGPAGREALSALNAEIEVLKKAEAENQAEIAFLKSENLTAQKRQSELLKELTALRDSGVTLSAGPIDTAQIQALNEKLDQAQSREAMMEKLLETLRRDLDIVHQTNEMLRGRLAKQKSRDTHIDFPKQAIGY